MKPPPAVKFAPCAEVASSATTVTTGTKSFQTTATMFVSASQRTPRTLMTQKRQEERRRDDVALSGQHRPAARDRRQPET